MIKILTLVLLSILSGISAKAQVMIKVAPGIEEKAKGVDSKYEFTPPQGVYHLGSSLNLYKNGRYEYYEANIPQSYYSVGKWRIKNKDIILNSSLQQTEVPIKIKYLIDSGVKVITRFSDIYDTKTRTPLYDAYVLVNNDTTFCYPSILICKGFYTKIDSIKIIFYDRMSSKWIKVEDRPFEKIEVVLETEEYIPAYIPMHNKHFALKGNSVLIKWWPLPVIRATPVYP